VDAVLANSAHEPFGLVGLEVMAGGGLAVTGSTGEDYAEPYRNALVMETQDPLELVAGLRLVKEQPGLSEQLRQRGRATALDFLWDLVIQQLLHRLELAASRQGVTLDSDGAVKPSPARRRKGG
jgi:glycosyltransferase involved in cell wall biosynthesis